MEWWFLLVCMLILTRENNYIVIAMHITCVDLRFQSLSSFIYASSNQTHYQWVIYPPCT